MLVTAKISYYNYAKYQYEQIYNKSFTLDFNFNEEHDIENIKDIKSELAMAVCAVANALPTKRNIDLNVIFIGENGKQIMSRVKRFSRTCSIYQLYIDDIYETLYNRIKHQDKSITILNYVYKPKKLGK